MRKDDHNPAAGEPRPESGTDGMYASTVTRPERRRRLAIAGVVGLLAVVGGGGAVAWQALDDPETSPTSEAGALVPPAGSASALPSAASVVPSVPPSVGARSKTSPAVTRPAPAPTRSRTDAERIRAARSAAAEENSGPSRQLPPTGDTAAATRVNETSTGSISKDRATFKVVSARQDLSGYRELGWVAGEGEPVGDARCTSTIRLSNDAVPRERPTLLICWRTSAVKSVYTVAVKVDGPPSKEASVAAIAKEWAKLG